MKRLAALLAVLVFPPVLTPAALEAQIFQSRHHRTLVGGIGVGLGVPLYDGEIVFQGVAQLPPPGEFDDAPIRILELTSEYQEELDVRREAWAGFTTGLFDEHYLFLRGRFGDAGSTATYRGGGALPETFDRSVRWVGADALAGVKVADGPRFRGTLYFGPSVTRYHLSVDGTGRDVIARKIGAGFRVEVDDVEWSDASWTNLNWIVGAETRLRVTESLGATLGLEARVLRSPGGGLESAARDDITEVIGRVPSISFQSSKTSLAPSLTVAVEWRLPGGGYSDPAVDAVDAVREVAEREEESPKEPPLPDAAVRALAEGDTARAIESLRGAVADDPDEPRLWGTLGTLLVHHSPSAEGEFEGRLEAREALDRALELDPGNPRWLIGLSALLERQGAPVDAHRVGRRALEAAAERPEAVTPEELAEVFFRRAKALERHVLNFEDLRFLATDRPPLNTPECSGLGAFCLNWVRPSWFFEWFEGLSELGSLVDHARAAMFRELERATEALPSHRRANRMALAWRARERDWAGFRERAEAYAEASPENPWARIFLATALYRTGDVEVAAPLFDAAVRRLEGEDREIFTNLRPLLPEDAAAAWDTLAPGTREAYRGVYWKKSDPLYLTGGNEREMGHYARVATAEILFGEPQTGRRGWETDRGDLVVRYGLPETRWQIRREDRLVLEAEEWQQAEGYGECAAAVAHAPTAAHTQPGIVGDAAMLPTLESLADAALTCELAPSSNVSNPDRGGRWVFWNYDPDEPSFVFEKDLGSLTVRHMAASRSRLASEDLRERSPATFEPPFHDAGPMPLQVARFRGIEPGTHELAVYARAPWQRLAGGQDDIIERGIFLFHGEEHRTVVAEKDRVPVGDGRLDFRVEMPPGLYAYSVEATSASGDTASVTRGEVALGTFAETDLRISDLLVTRTLEAGEGSVERYRDLDFMALRCLALPRNRTVGVVFEVYELAVEDGTGRYRVTVDTGEDAPGNVVADLLRSVRNLFRDEEAGTVAFEREVEIEPGEWTVEWFLLEVPEEAGDEVELAVTVTDLRTGEATTGRRRLERERCAE